MHSDRLHAGITMSTSREFSERRSDQAIGRPTALQNANSNGDGYDKFVDVNLHSTERRRRPQPGTPEEYLHQLPALILLERLAIPMLATRLDGVVAYANPPLRSASVPCCCATFATEF
jgi:hypothetical protein